MSKSQKPKFTEVFRQLRTEGDPEGRWIPSLTMEGKPDSKGKSSGIPSLTMEGTSMRRRFVVYIVSAIVLAGSLIVLLLHVFGILNLTNGRLMDELETKLAVYTDDMGRDYDKQAAYALSLGEQLEGKSANALFHWGVVGGQSC